MTRSILILTIITGIAYNEDVNAAVELIEKTLSICETVAKDRPIQVFPQAFANSSIDIAMACGLT